MRFSKYIIPLLFLVAVLGASGAVCLYVEFQPDIADIHRKMYPGLFLWPLIIYPAACVALSWPLRLITVFIATHLTSVRLTNIIFFGPIVLIPIGMSSYEWFYSKPAIYELSQRVSASRIPPASIHASQLSFSSYDELLHQIRTGPPVAYRISECRFGGTDFPAYAATRCWCVPDNRIVTGAECDQSREYLYNNLKYLTQDPHNRSMTFYVSKLAFTAMCVIFSAGLMSAIFLKRFEKALKARHNKEYHKAHCAIQITEILCLTWWPMYLYFSYLQLSIFPNAEGPVFLSPFWALALGLPLLIAGLAAFGKRFRNIKDISEKWVAPTIAIIAAALGVLRPDIFDKLFGLVFGIQSSIGSIMAFVTFVFVACLAPLINYFIYSGHIKLVHNTKTGDR